MLASDFEISRVLFVSQQTKIEYFGKDFEVITTPAKYIVVLKNKLGMKKNVEVDVKTFVRTIAMPWSP